jgi:hypothetical protein
MKAPTLFRSTAALLAVSLGGGCAIIPTGPSAAVMPGAGKSLAEFQSDDGLCRQFAHQQVSGEAPKNAAAASAVTSAAVGTAVGAAAGAALGGGRGAAVGAGTGLLAGSVIGTGTGHVVGQTLQQRYDTAYQQCMVTRGDLVPGVPYYVSARHAPIPPPPPPPGYKGPPIANPGPPPGYGAAPPPPPRS